MDEEMREIPSVPPMEEQNLPDLKIEPHHYKPIFGPKNTLQKKGTREIPVFHPTPKDMLNFSVYVENIEKKRAHLDSGIAKIVPPQGWLSSASKNFNYDGLGNMTIKRCLAGKVQKVNETLDGVYFQENHHRTFNKNGTTVSGFMSKASGPSNLPKKCKTLDGVVDYFWTNIDSSRNSSAVYGADVEGTLFGDSIEHFNPNKLNTIMDLAKESGMEIPGITAPYLYFGSYRTAFPWHTEDLDLYSLNYQHFGEPKIWYSIPSATAGRFERLCAQLYKPFGIACHTFIRHKICITRPDILEKYQIPYGCIAQYPGEFILTFPRGYHMGFNVGFNCNEAINFSTHRWLGYGLQSNICNCNPEMAVRMNLKDILQGFAENDLYKEYFIREPTKPTERKSLPVATREYIKEAMPMMERLLLFNSSFEREIEYNEERAEISPFCCVCQCFTPPTNCQLKGPIKHSSKSPCYISQQMLTKAQNSSNVPYRPDRASGTPYLPFPDSPLRQCVHCKVAVHANCYSFIEGLPKGKSKFSSSQKPPEIQRVPSRTPVPCSYEIKPKPIRISVPKHCLIDANIEKEESLSPVSSSSLPKKKMSTPKAAKLTPPKNGTTTSNNIYNKIMKRVVKTEIKGDGNQPSSKKFIIVKEEPTAVKSSALKLQKKPTDAITVIKPIVSRYEIFGESSEKGDIKSEQSQESSSQPTESEWLCDPCRLIGKDDDRRKYVCCDFCNMRGGALIQRKIPDLTETSYIHVICGILSRLTSINRNEKDELVAHCLPPPREYSALKNVKKNVLPTADNKIRLCSTYASHDKSLFCGNFDDNFCGLCKEPLHEVLVKCEKCHLEARKMDVYHPTCANLIGFQFSARSYPEIVVATCPAHFDLSNDPREDIKVGDTVVHVKNDEFKTLAEVNFIGTITSDILLSFQGGYSEVTSSLVLTCECRALGCGGNHFPGYLIAIRNRGALGVTLGVFRGRHTERSFRVKHDDGLALTCKRNEIFIQKDSNCPADYKRMLVKRKAEKELLEQMNVPIKRERRAVLSNLIPEDFSFIKSEPIEQVNGAHESEFSNVSINGTNQLPTDFVIKQEVEDQSNDEQSIL